jgi:hypothetical protein
MESVGLKEWALVCEAINRGEQCVVVRKGGIAEGREGFGFRYSEFFLFPTFFHEQIDQVRGNARKVPSARAGEVEIRLFAKLIGALRISSLETALALEPLHVLQPTVIRERFNYDRSPWLHVALVRAFRLEPAWVFPDAPRYGGCRSWIDLSECPSETRFEPVLTDQEHDRRVEDFHRLTNSERFVIT